MNTINRTFQTLSNYAYPIAVLGVGIAAAGFVTSHVPAIITGLCLATLAALVRYLYPTYSLPIPAPAAPIPAVPPIPTSIPPTHTPPVSPTPTSAQPHSSPNAPIVPPPPAPTAAPQTLQQSSSLPSSSQTALVSAPLKATRIIRKTEVSWTPSIDGSWIAVKGRWPALVCPVTLPLKGNHILDIHMFKTGSSYEIRVGKDSPLESYTHPIVYPHPPASPERFLLDTQSFGEEDSVQLDFQLMENHPTFVAMTTSIGPWKHVYYIDYENRSFPDANGHTFPCVYLHPPAPLSETLLAQKAEFVTSNFGKNVIEKDLRGHDTEMQLLAYHPLQGLLVWLNIDERMFYTTIACTDGRRNSFSSSGEARVSIRLQTVSFSFNRSFNLTFQKTQSTALSVLLNGYPARLLFAPPTVQQIVDACNETEIPIPKVLWKMVADYVHTIDLEELGLNIEANRFKSWQQERREANAASRKNAYEARSLWFEKRHNVRFSS